MKLQSLEEIWEECKVPFVAEQMIDTPLTHSFFYEINPVGTIATVIEKKPLHMVWLGVSHTYEYQGTYQNPSDPECEEVLRIDHREKLWKKLR